MKLLKICLTALILVGILKSSSYAAIETYIRKIVRDPGASVIVVEYTDGAGFSETKTYRFSDFSIENFKSAVLSQLASYTAISGVPGRIQVGLFDPTPAPVITSVKTVEHETGVAFTYQIVATNSPTAYSVDVLPTGLSISTTTGVISGTPTSAGAFTSKIRADNSGGFDRQNLNFVLPNLAARAQDKYIKALSKLRQMDKALLLGIITSDDAAYVAQKQKVIDDYISAYLDLL